MYFSSSLKVNSVDISSITDSNQYPDDRQKTFETANETGKPQINLADRDKILPNKHRSIICTTDLWLSRCLSDKEFKQKHPITLLEQAVQAKTPNNIIRSSSKSTQ